MINELKKGFLKFTFNGENKSVDKSMIPYYGNHASRQRINNKPIRVRSSIWVLAEADGFVVQFKPNQSAKKGKKGWLLYLMGIRRKRCSAADGMLPSSC